MRIFEMRNNGIKRAAGQAFLFLLANLAPPSCLMWPRTLTFAQELIAHYGEDVAANEDPEKDAKLAARVCLIEAASKEAVVASFFVDGVVDLVDGRLDSSVFAALERVFRFSLVQNAMGGTPEGREVSLEHQECRVWVSLMVEVCEAFLEPRPLLGGHRNLVAFGVAEELLFFRGE